MILWSASRMWVNVLVPTDTSTLKATRWVNNQLQNLLF
jgi:hypothetical protein